MNSIIITDNPAEMIRIGKELFNSKQDIYIDTMITGGLISKHYLKMKSNCNSVGTGD